MSPLEEYNTIIYNRQQSPLLKGGELHHIIPKACGGPATAKWNLVRLTFEEHYKAHELLTKIYTTGAEHRAMVFAWHLMQGVQGKHCTCDESARLKREKCELMRQLFKGKPLSAEHRAKLSAVKKGKPGHRHVVSEETKRRISAAMKGKKHKQYIHTAAFWEKQARKKKLKERKDG